MYQRVVTIVVCAILAALAVVSGLDRDAVGRPAHAGRVPSAFAVQATIVQAQQAILAGQFAVGEGLARKAVAAAPIEPESTALLATARLGLGQTDRAEQAFRVAGQFGWRTPITQYYWMRQALVAGDYRVAALRLDAMLRQDPGAVTNLDLLAPLQASAEGRAAMVDRLLAGPLWLAPYAQEVYSVPGQEAAIRASVFEGLAQRGKPAACETVAPLVNKLIGTRQWAEAVRLWRMHCPLQFSGMIADGSFAKLEVHQARVPFEWSVIGDSDVSLNLESDPAGRAKSLVIASTASFSRKVLMQMIVLPPGRYRLNWTAVARDGTPSGRIKAAITCDSETRGWQNGTFNPALRNWTMVAQVGAECPASWISIAIQPGNDAVLLRDISLDRD